MFQRSTQKYKKKETSNELKLTWTPTTLREYLHLPPPILLKLSGLEGSDLERNPSPNLAAEINFYYTKIALKIEQKL